MPDFLGELNPYDRTPFAAFLYISPNYFSISEWSLRAENGILFSLINKDMNTSGRQRLPYRDMPLYYGSRNVSGAGTEIMLFVSAFSGIGFSTGTVIFL